MTSGGGHKKVLDMKVLGLVIAALVVIALLLTGPLASLARAKAETRTASEEESSRVLDIDEDDFVVDFDDDDDDNDNDEEAGEVDCDLVLDLIPRGLLNRRNGGALIEQYASTGDIIISPTLIQECIILEGNDENNDDDDDDDDVDELIIEDRTGEPDGQVVETANVPRLLDTGVGQPSPPDTGGPSVAVLVAAFVLASAGGLGVLLWRRRTGV